MCVTADISTLELDPQTHDRHLVFNSSTGFRKEGPQKTRPQKKGPR